MKFLIVLLPVAALGQIRAQFSDPNAPGIVRVELVSGGINVRGADINEVIVEVRGKAGAMRRESEAPPGMRRIGGGGGEVTVRESRNVIRIESEGHTHQDVDVQVPRKVALKLETVNNGGIAIEGVEGEIEVENVNGGIRLNNVSGSVVANTLNGKLECVLVKAFPDKPMALTTLNGPIDVTLPADMKATLRMRSDNGDIFSDFDVTVRSERVESKSRRGWKGESAIVADINGGGPEVRLQTMNGKIYVRKRK
jgi:DUF4097 and DUF4098 domain-containing protein YvlB